MDLPQVVPLSLLSAAFVFAVIELGLTGYVVSLFTQGSTEYRYDPWSNEYSTQKVKIAVPSILAFMLFNSVWTMLVTAAAAIIPWVFRTRAATGTALDRLIAIGFLTLYSVTSVFWLASFADIAASFAYAFFQSDYVNAIIAFAVLLWLLFCALIVVVVLAMCGVLKSDIPGYRPLGKQDSPATAPQSTQMDQI
ncbi:hypothetical protein BDV26DRAFT_208362 [Aspergillus bertholletiae]|uniref:MARVEL domain-containing protein n=1 Tax=Aspergillus bertholletiae TaxID=1226010 RepID=A0A5N7B7C5_9EURO|nr:hypothetical protein BDV26DRAFT_208362 [Aspergillus bertholletiae]